ncbi:MAG: glutamine--tRNA ligase/YqeY domain fusion protein [Desulfobacterales bacterium]|nr:glutamine--tRNA ligase/YqeY domain fusion protein [Desulfobacterales bacterium]
MERENKIQGNFITNIIDNDIRNNKNNGKVVTRFPPEPNGYLHIGHAKSICLNFGIALLYNGRCHLRFDDTNPEKEDQKYIDAIMTDVHWLGFDWGEHLHYTSDYFERLYSFALTLIEQGKAYVCSLSPDEIRKYRGTLTEPGIESPYRSRSIVENMDLFQRMRSGEFEEGAHVLRAKIDMASPNIALRDPTLYRIKQAHHPRTGQKWTIYPMYDFSHCLSDAIEGITHSICTLEFENNRPLYDWFLDQLPVPCHPQQIEFARLNLTYTVMSKRILLKLVSNGHVSGWDDPRMPTIAGLRRRGYTKEAIRMFCERIGVAKRDSMVEMALLEHCLRDDLNTRAPRVMAVLHPIKVIILNLPEGEVIPLQALNHPEKPEMGDRTIYFSREIYIDQEDFMENPPKKFYRLSPGREVRLRYAFIIKCESIIKDQQTGDITELHCTYDPLTQSGSGAQDRKVKATIHWLSAIHAIPADVRLYDTLFNVENPAAAIEHEPLENLINPKSLEVLTTCFVESELSQSKPGVIYQFERIGYFCLDSNDSGKLVFNRTVSLKDQWAKIQKQSM